MSQTPPQPIVWVTPTNKLFVKDAGAVGVIWTLSATGQVLRAGIPLVGGSGTSYMTIINNMVWAQDALTKKWFTHPVTQIGNWVPGTPPSLPPPLHQPVNVDGLLATASPLYSKITLKWTAFAGAKSYTVQYKTDSSKVWTTAPVVPANMTSATITDLLPGETYNCQVFANT